ncbi:ABC transporter ATP-binding protein [Mesoplasma seiffertii]|uniref:ABC transporter ATP-binding protein n=1 Tax=Mesoplasma seiffertii TaxID=28224 RepID=UPI001FE18320|nr:ABC transporter ATP-binding protein [Mesoplasma seiffertii]
MSEIDHIEDAQDHEKYTRSSSPKDHMEKILNPQEEAAREFVESSKRFKKAGKGSFYKLVFRYMIRNKWWTIGILISVVIVAVSTAITPKIIEQLMLSVEYKIKNKLDLDSANKWWGLQWQSVVYIQLGFLILLAASTYCSQWIAGMLGKQIEVDLRNDITKKLIELDMSYYSDKKIGEILTKVVSDTQILGEQTGIIPVTTLTALLTLVFSIISLATIDVTLTFVAIGLFVLIFSSFGLAYIPLKKLLYNLRKSITKTNGSVIDRINTVKLIKASGTEKYESERFVEMHKEYHDNYKKLNYSQSVMLTILFLGINSIQIILIVIAASLYKDTPDYLKLILPSLIIAIGMMIGPIMALLRVVVGLMQAATAATRIEEILEEKTRFNNHFEDKQGIHIDKISGDIHFKDITFCYPEKPDKVILPNFDFTLKEGKSYAFVGETGAGKSTISKLLLRFYDPTKGQVLINNNIDLKDVYLSSYLNHVGYVEQEPSILLGNVYDNVRYSRFEASDEEVINACKKAELHELIMSWPEGYNTILGERGFMLSGGQKQRLVIARMFLKDPKILILDEATSALDNIVEKEIQGKLDELMKGRTTISIAHRLSTIKNVDQIIVLGPQKGIVQIGTFEQLKTTPGHFKKLYDAGQSKNDL